MKGSPVDPRTHLRIAIQRLVWPADSAFSDGGKTWEPVGNKFAYDGDSRNAPVVRRHAAPLGVQASLASRAVADRSRYGLCRSGRRRAIPLDRRRHRHGRSSPACAGTVRTALAAWRRRDVLAHDLAGSQQSQADLYRHIGRRGVPHRRRRQAWQPINRGLRSRIHT